MSIGQTIADQIGRPAFFMLGAKNLVATEKGLTFKVGRNAKAVTHVQIELDEGLDLYSLTFLRVHGMKTTTKSETPAVYFDQLRIAITAGTGLDTSL